MRFFEDDANLCVAIRDMERKPSDSGLVAKQLIIENHTLLACPHCWKREQITEEYPELAKYPVSDRLCNTHYEILLARAMGASKSFDPKRSAA